MSDIAYANFKLNIVITSLGCIKVIFSKNHLLSLFNMADVTAVDVISYVPISSRQKLRSFTYNHSFNKPVIKNHPNNYSSELQSIVVLLKKDLI